MLPPSPAFQPGRNKVKQSTTNRFEGIRRCLEGGHGKFSLSVDGRKAGRGIYESPCGWKPQNLSSTRSPEDCLTGTLLFTAQCAHSTFPSLPYSSSYHSVTRVAEVQVLRDWSWQRFPNPVLGNAYDRQHLQHFGLVVCTLVHFGQHSSGPGWCHL